MKTPLRSASGRPCAGRRPLSLQSRLPRLQPGAPALTLNLKVGTGVNGGNCRRTSQQPDRASVHCSTVWPAAALPGEVGGALHVKLWHAGGRASGSAASKDAVKPTLTPGARLAQVLNALAQRRHLAAGETCLRCEGTRTLCELSLHSPVLGLQCIASCLPPPAIHIRGVRCSGLDLDSNALCGNIFCAGRQQDAVILV